jgi:hypothetical protein
MINISPLKKQYLKLEEPIKRLRGEETGIQDMSEENARIFRNFEGDFQTNCT